MARYDAREIVENIEQVLREEEAASAGESALEQSSRFRDARSSEAEPSSYAKLERANLRNLRSVQEVDKIPEGSRFGIFKKAMMRILRLVSARQAAYNFNNVQALELLGTEIDALRARIRSLEEGRTRPLGMAQLEGAELRRLSAVMGHHLAHVQSHTDMIARRMAEVGESLVQMVENLSAVSGRINQLNMVQADSSSTIARTQLDVTRLWSELSLVYESIDDRAEDIWRGLDERDQQLLLNTEAAQHLHSQVSAAETGLKELKARLLQLAEQLAIHQEMMENLKEEMAEPVMKVRAAGPRPAVAAATAEAAAAPAESHFMAHEVRGPDPFLQRQLDSAYLRFQRQFRGDEGELRARQKDYVALLENRIAKGADRPRVLDIACGDGIFVEIMKQHGWDCLGVDINEAMVKQGQSRGLPVEKADAIAFVEGTEARSWDAITAFQFVEHLPPWVLMKMLRAALKALKPGGVLLIETINPHTLKALHWFHLDLTHERLVFPEMLGLLCETAGFSSIEWKGVNPVAEGDRLRADGSEIERANIRKLNDLLFGNQDYWLVARRAGGDPAAT